MYTTASGKQEADLSGALLMCALELEVIEKDDLLEDYRELSMQVVNDWDRLTPESYEILSEELYRIKDRLTPLYRSWGR
jgi:hypothetical protein